MAFSTDRCTTFFVGKRLPCIAFSVAVAALLVSGCGRRATSPNLPPPLPNTPDGKLEGVMRRFRSNLEDAHSAAGSGVKSKRSASVRKIEPTGKDSTPKAEVTVVTTVAVDQTPPDESDNPENDPAKQAALADKSGATEKPVPKTIEPVITNETFALIYDGQYWTIAERPKDQIIRDCIDYALKGQ
jgi:hypothetical protein